MKPMFAEQGFEMKVQYVGPLHFHRRTLSEAIGSAQNTPNCIKTDVTIGDTKNAWDLFTRMARARSSTTHSTSVSQEGAGNQCAIPEADDLALISAAANGGVERVSRLVGHISNPDQKDHETWTALHHATWHGHEDIVGALISAFKVNLDIPDGRGQRALHLAAERGNENIMNLLLESDRITLGSQGRE